jgi:hypothetical protein
MLCVVQVRHRYRIYPSPGQQQALSRAFGCARVVYNDCLRLRDACHAAGETISDTEVQRRVVTVAKRTPERAWLAEVASVVLVLEFMERLIAAVTEPGDVIWEPFGGLCSVMLGRHAYAAETDPAFADLAADRLAQGTLWP